MANPRMRVIVVGAGAAGLFTAEALAQAGAVVRVLERGAGAGRASAVAAGMLAPWAEGAQEKVARPQFTELGVESLALWRERPGFVASGSLLVSENAEAAHAALSAAHPEAEAHPMSAETVWPGLRAREAVLLPREGRVDPLAAIEALRARLTIETGVEALGPVLKGERIVGVETAAGPMEADAVVLAPGAFAGAAWIEVAPALARLTPARGTLVEARAPAGYAARPNLRAPNVYAAPQPDGRLLIGASMEFGVAEEAPNLAAAAGLEAHFQALDPGFSALPGRAVAGVRAMSPDWAPLIGPAGPAGLFLAAGMSRNGWLLGPVTGRILRGYLAGDDLPPLFAAFRPDRFDRP